jgi:lysine/arginine/ornithine transport system substrate-binding protein
LNNRIVRGWFAGALVALAFAFGTTAPARADQQVVRIGTEADYAPFEYKDAGGQLRGFEIELGTAMCAHAKLKCEWVNLSFDSMIAALQSKKIDAVLSQMSITPQREKVVDFTVPLTIAPARFIAKKGSGISDDPATLKGKTIGVQSGTTEESYYNQKLKGIAAVKVYQGQDEAYQDLMSGRIDAALADETIEYDWLQKQGKKAGFDYAGKELNDPAIFGKGTGIAVRKGDALRGTLNASFAAVVKDGTYKKINAQYFPFSILPPK